MVVACSCPSTLCNARWVSINFKVSSEIRDALRCTCCSVLSTELRSSSRNKQSAFVLVALVGGLIGNFRRPLKYALFLFSFVLQIMYRTM
eukprot:scaffold88940_cov68-Attheya_sp.AAC.1